MNEAARPGPDRFGEVRSCPERPPRKHINTEAQTKLQSLIFTVSARDMPVLAAPQLDRQFTPRGTKGE